MVSSSGSWARACIPAGKTRVTDAVGLAASTVETGMSASKRRRERSKERGTVDLRGMTTMGDDARLGHHPGTILGYDVIDRPGARSGQGNAESRGGEDRLFLPGDLASFDEGNAPEQEGEQDDAEHFQGDQDPSNLGQEPDDEQETADQLDDRHHPGHES